MCSFNAKNKPDQMAQIFGKNKRQVVVKLAMGVIIPYTTGLLPVAAAHPKLAICKLKKAGHKWQKVNRHLL